MAAVDDKDPISFQDEVARLAENMWRRDVIRLLCILARSNMDRFQADEHVSEIERRWFND